MSNSFPAITDKARTHRAATSKAMKRMATAAKCPECNRKSALRRICDGGFWMVTCRWCGYERGGYIGG